MQILCIQYRHLDTWGGGGGGVQLHDCMLHGRDGRERDNGMEPYRGRKLSAMTI